MAFVWDSQVTLSYFLEGSPFPDVGPPPPHWRTLDEADKTFNSGVTLA